MNERNDAVIGGRNACYRAPENFCRAIFLQLAKRIQRRRTGDASRILSRFFAHQAESAFNSTAGFALWDDPPAGPGFGDPARRALLIRAMRDVVASIEASATAPENWNACDRWRDWGIVKARELLAFFEAEARD